MEKNSLAMPSVHQSSLQSRCPSRQELADFSMGKASDLASDAIAAHAASCQQCLRVLAELERERDPMIEQLRESFCDSPIAADEAHRVAARLEAFREAWYASALQQKPAEPAVGLSTDPTTLQLRCPFCHEPSLAGASSGSESIVCPNCRGRFSLALEGSDDQDAHPGARIAHFELLERLGEGSFGTVWKAYDTVLHRLVALKLPRKSHLSSKHVEAFVREARLAAQLQHPGIVHVYEVGVDKDAVYLASELIEGRTLRVALDQHRYSAREAAALCLAVTEAVRTAHAAGMVHRDLKPANILLDAAGKPHIADFGLAKHVAIDVVATVEGRVLGTPMYMSPEQAYGDGVVIDERSDIYSIGTILYELLTGRPPFDGDIHILVAKILLEEPTPPRTFRENLPRDLETICLKCLEKSPGRRYQTAEGLATDLRLYLEGKPICARPVTRLARCWRWSRRNPLLSTVSAVALLLLISTVAALAVGNWRTGAALQVAERNLYFHSLASAQQSWLANDPRTADAILDQCPEGLRNFEWGYLKHLVRTPVRRLYNAGGSVAYRPDGSNLATGGGREPSLKIWNAENDQRMHRLIGHEDALLATVYDPTGARIASAGQADKTVQVWDAASGRRLHVFAEHRWPVDDCAFSPDGSQVLAYDRDNQVHVWDLASGECVQTMPLHLQRVRDVAFSPVAPHLAVASRRGESSELSIYDYQDQTLVKRIPAFESAIGNLAFSADGKRLAAGEVRRAIRIWQVEPELHLLATLAGPVADKCRVVFDASGERVAAEAYDGTIRIWELARGETVAILRGHSRPVYQLAFSPDGKQLAAGVGGNEVIIWDLTTEQGSRVYQVGRAAVNDLAVCRDGRLLAAAFADGKIGIWDRASGEARHMLQDAGQTAWSVAFSPDGTRLGTAGDDTAVRIYNTVTGGLELQYTGHIRPLRCVQFSPDGKLAASAGLDSTVHVWDAATGHLTRKFRLKGPSLRSLAFHPDGRRLAAGGASPIVSVFDVISGEQLWTQNAGKLVRTWQLAFSPDGTLLAISRGDGTVTLCRAEDGTPVQRIGDLAEESPVALAFSPDGQRLATATARTAVSVWETDSWRNVLTVSRNPSISGAIAFTPDGQALITGHTSGNVHLWPTIGDRSAPSSPAH